MPKENPTRKQRLAKIGFFDSLPSEAMNMAPIELKPLMDERKVGHGPQKPIDRELFAKLAFLCPSFAELASFFNMTPEGFQMRCEKEPDLIELINKGRQASKLSIRRTMLRLALNGEPQMLKLLAMQPDMLNMRDDKPKGDTGVLTREQVKSVLLGALDAAKVINADIESEKRTINQSLTKPLDIIPVLIQHDHL